MNDYITGFLDGMKLTKYLAEKIVKDASGYRDFKKRLDMEVNIGELLYRLSSHFPFSSP